GDVMTPGSSTFLIRRDPARAIRRGRQLFQRKYRIVQGLGPRSKDGVGDLDTNGALGAGISDSCAGCHGRPRGAAGFGAGVAAAGRAGGRAAAGTWRRAATAATPRTCSGSA